MAAGTPSRKQRFQAALALSGMTAKEFASLHGVSNQHLSHVLSGKRTSARISDAIDRFILSVTKKHGGSA